MRWYEDRMANGLAKAGGGAYTQEEIQRVLSQDVIIEVDPSRVTLSDLWPATWALAATLSRQFTGTIYIKAGLKGPLPSPASLSGRCLPPACPLGIGLGTSPEDSSAQTSWGDAKGNHVSIGHLLPGSETAPAWTAFAVAGYLAYALLASTAGFVPYKERFARPSFQVGIPAPPLLDTAAQDLAILGLGHLGNAYVALLYFLGRQYTGLPRLWLLDRGQGEGHLERANWKTHLLLDESYSWEGLMKTEVLGTHLRTLIGDVCLNPTTLHWGWTKPADHPSYALLGLDSFDARRIAVGGGYQWCIDGGVGTRFDRARVTWHSIPADGQLAKMLFQNSSLQRQPSIPPDSPLARNLEDPTDPCGWIGSFHGVSAAAPSMGVVAAAYAVSELINLWLGTNRAIAGSAQLWSPGIPPTTSCLLSSSDTFQEVETATRVACSGSLET